MNKPYSVAVLVGSLRRDSINRKVSGALSELAPRSLELALVEIGGLSLYNPDDEAYPHVGWTKFRDSSAKCVPPGWPFPRRIGRSCRASPWTFPLHRVDAPCAW